MVLKGDGDLRHFPVLIPFETLNDSSYQHFPLKWLFGIDNFLHDDDRFAVTVA